MDEHHAPGTVIKFVFWLIYWNFSWYTSLFIVYIGILITSCIYWCYLRCSDFIYLCLTSIILVLLIFVFFIFCVCIHIYVYTLTYYLFMYFCQFFLKLLLCVFYHCYCFMYMLCEYVCRHKCVFCFAPFCSQLFLDFYEFFSPNGPSISCQHDATRNPAERPLRDGRLGNICWHFLRWSTLGELINQRTRSAVKRRERAHNLHPVEGKRRWISARGRTAGWWTRTLGEKHKDITEDQR